MKRHCKSHFSPFFTSSSFTLIWFSKFCVGFLPQLYYSVLHVYLLLLLHKFSHADSTTTMLVYTTARQSNSANFFVMDHWPTMKIFAHAKLVLFSQYKSTGLPLFARHNSPDRRADKVVPQQKGSKKERLSTDFSEDGSAQEKLDFCAFPGIFLSSFGWCKWRCRGWVWKQSRPR